MRASAMKSAIASKVEASSWSKPTIMPHRRQFHAVACGVPVQGACRRWAAHFDASWFPKRVLIGSFDADKNALKIGEPHQFHEFFILGKIERGLGEESERISPLLLPANNLAQDRLNGLLVADQIVIDDENDTEAREADGLSSAKTCSLVLSRDACRK